MRMDSRKKTHQLIDSDGNVFVVKRLNTICCNLQLQLGPMAVTLQPYPCDMCPQECNLVNIHRVQKQDASDLVWFRRSLNVNLLTLHQLLWLSTIAHFVCTVLYNSAWSSLKIDTPIDYKLYCTIIYFDKFKTQFILISHII